MWRCCRVGYSTCAVYYCVAKYYWYPRQVDRIESCRFLLTNVKSLRQHPATRSTDWPKSYLLPFRHVRFAGRREQNLLDDYFALPPGNTKEDEPTPFFRNFVWSVANGTTAGQQRMRERHKELKVKEAKCRFHDTIWSHLHHANAHYNLTVVRRSHFINQLTQSPGVAFLVILCFIWLYLLSTVVGDLLSFIFIWIYLSSDSAPRLAPFDSAKTMYCQTIWSMAELLAEPSNPLLFIRPNDDSATDSAKIQKIWNFSYI